MPSNEVLKYFDVTSNRDTRDDLRLAVDLVKGDKIAIDCGCGAGSDIAFLRSNDFLVYAFDIEEEAIFRCTDRFSNDDRVILSQSSFNAFSYPNASLIVADSSLFFCPEFEFSEVWYKMTESLVINGVFSVSFLGPEDTMAGPQYDKEAYWPDVLILSKEQIEKLFTGFKVESFTEHKSSGKAPDGKPHKWHIFSVVAVKKSNMALKQGPRGHRSAH